MPWKFFGNSGYKKPPVEVSNSLSGDIVMFAGPQSGVAGTLAEAQSAPTGYLFCNGAVISKITNPEYGNLWSALTKNGTVGLYGAFTANTATLPNFDDKFVRGAATGANVGTATNTSTHSHTIGSHSHNLLDHSHPISDDSISGHTHSLNHSHSVGDHTHGAGTLFNSNDSAQIGTRAGGPSQDLSVASANHSHNYGGNSAGITVSNSPEHAAPNAGMSMLTMATAPGSGITSTTGTSAVTTGSTGGIGTTPANNIPVFRAINFMIKV